MLTRLLGVCDGSRIQTHRKEKIRVPPATISLDIDAKTRIFLQDPLISDTHQMLDLSRILGILGFSSGSEVSIIFLRLLNANRSIGNRLSIT